MSIAKPGARVVVGDRPLLVSDHAVERYHERVRPTLPDRVAALGELRLVLASARWAVERPEWAPAGEVPLRTSGFVVLGDSVVFPVAGSTLTTCLVRGSVSELAAERRRAQRAHRAQVRKALRQNRAKVGERRFGRAPRPMDEA